MTYSLGHYGDSDPCFTGLREFWQRSYIGAFLSDYDAGVLLGKADLVADNFTNFENEIDHVPGELRDSAWDAKLDGYRDATRKERGPTDLSNGF